MYILWLCESWKQVNVIGIPTMAKTYLTKPTSTHVKVKILQKYHAIP